MGEWLDKYPNMYVDIDARISELGRQPYTARRFFLKYQDRILFGTDTTPRREAFRIYYRFLETDDEYFDCAASHHLQGFWKIYGVFLPPEVLEKVYRKNAERVLYGLKSDKRPNQPPRPKQSVLTSRRPRISKSPATARRPPGRRPSGNHCTARRRGPPTTTRVKVLYSKTGLYFLMQTPTDHEAHGALEGGLLRTCGHEDVFEVFLWPDERDTALLRVRDLAARVELPILVPNLGRQVPGLAAVALRGRSQDPQGHQRHRRRKGSGAASPAGRPRSSSPTSCSIRWATSRPSPAPAGGPTSTAWTSTTAQHGLGLGPRRPELP